MRCSTLQCAAVRCSALQRVAVRCSALHCVSVRCKTLQCVAVHCSALHCSVLQCVAVCCGVIAVCCSVTPKQGTSASARTHEHKHALMNAHTSTANVLCIWKETHVLIKRDLCIYDIMKRDLCTYEKRPMNIYTEVCIRGKRTMYI